MAEPALSKKEMRELRARFKQGYTLEATGSSALRVLDPNGEIVRRADSNQPLTLHPTPSDYRTWIAYEQRLEDAGVLQNGTSKPYDDKGESSRRQALERMNESRREARVKEAKELHDRLAVVLKPFGGFELPGIAADLSYIGAMLGREMKLEAQTPDLYQGSIHRVANNAWVEPRYQEVWNEIAERLEQSKDVHETWFALVRESRGLEEDKVAVKHPVSDDWPFRVELLPIEAFVVDHDYQRPVPWPFVRKIAASYDESLVGTIDVSERRKGAVHAILDGQLRFEASKLVGKKTIWASIYSGLDRPSEARFFLHKNQDRKAVHPFYTWRARIVANDPEALEIERIVRKAGYVISLTAAKMGTKNENAISAVAAVELAYRRGDPAGYECLTPTLETLHNSFFGMEHGQANMLIRGLSHFFSLYEESELDRKHLEAVLQSRGPRWLLTRMREESLNINKGAATGMTRLIVNEYNRGLERGSKLEKRI